MLLAVARMIWWVHHQELSRISVALLPLFLQLHPRVTMVVAAARGTEHEDQPAAACRRLDLGLDAWGWDDDGCLVAGVLVHVGHLVQWRVVVGHLLHQLGGLAVPIFAVRTSEVYSLR